MNYSYELSKKLERKRAEAIKAVNEKWLPAFIKATLERPEMQEELREIESVSISDTVEGFSIILAAMLPEYSKAVDKYIADIDSMQKANSGLN